jgi:hypothetical protein
MSFAGHGLVHRARSWRNSSSTGAHDHDGAIAILHFLHAPSFSLRAKLDL